MSYEKQFLISLLITLAIEMPLVFYLLVYFFKNKEIAKSKIIFVSFLASTLTLPYLWFILPHLILDQALYYVLGEALVIFFEAIIFKQLFALKFSRAFIISLIANVASIIIGLLIV